MLYNPVHGFQFRSIHNVNTLHARPVNIVLLQPNDCLDINSFGNWSNRIRWTLHRIYLIGVTTRYTYPVQWRRHTCEEQQAGYRKTHTIHNIQKRQLFQIWALLYYYDCCCRCVGVSGRKLWERFARRSRPKQRTARGPPLARTYTHIYSYATVF